MKFGTGPRRATTASGAGPAPRAAPPSAEIRVGDARDLLATLPDGSVDLVYADPPFGTGRLRRGRPGSGLAYSDGRADAEEFLSWIEPILRGCHRVLGRRGSLLLHCDWRHSHRLRLLLDAIFGPERFVNHLVWSYGLGGSSPRAFARKHDDILFYGRSEDYWFEAPRVPATSRRMAGRDKKATDVLAIPSLNNNAAERTGWPTQKPLALLRLLVSACSPPGGLVLDPFCGSGTAPVAAVQTGRRALGFDIDPRAAALARRRLAAAAEIDSSSGPHAALAQSQPRHGALPA